MAATADLIVPLEFPFMHYASDTSAASGWTSGYHDFNRSLLPFNSSDYDGTCTYYFEVVASNVNASNAYSVYLYDSTNATVEATCSVPANTTVANSTRIRSSAFTPASGDVTYKVRLDATGTASDLGVYAARIIIVQEDATKTRIQIPLLGAYASLTEKQDTQYDAADYTTSTTYTQGLPHFHAMWARDDADWGTGTTFEFECAMATNSGTAYVALYNVTEGQIVTASEVTTTSSTISIKNSGALSGTYWQDGDTYEVRLKGSSGTNYCNVFSAQIYAVVTDLSKAEVYWLINSGLTAASAAAYNQYQRVKLDTGSYSSPTFYGQYTALAVTSPQSVLYLYDDSTDDSGTAGASAVSGSNATAPTTKNVVRSSALSGLTSGNRLIFYRGTSTYNVTPSPSFVVVAVAGSAGVTAPVIVATQVGSSITVSWS